MTNPFDNLNTPITPLWDVLVSLLMRLDEIETERAALENLIKDLSGSETLRVPS